MTDKQGKIIILNGAPRSGKSSIAAAIQDRAEGIWMNLGVDSYMKATPSRLQPGIGLRPGGECPELEPTIAVMYRALFESIAAHSRLGLNVVADFGFHEKYSVLEDNLSSCFEIIRGLPVYFIGVCCDLEEIIRRRQETNYPACDAEGNVNKPIILWQDTVHADKIYDLVVDTGRNTSEECAIKIIELIDSGQRAEAAEKMLSRTGKTREAGQDAVCIKKK